MFKYFTDLVNSIFRLAFLFHHIFLFFTSILLSTHNVYPQVWVYCNTENIPYSCPLKTSFAFSITSTYLMSSHFRCLNCRKINENKK